MLWSKTFIPTLKETPMGIEAISHQLLLRAGLVRMLTSGVYTYLPLGLRVLNNIENIIREELNAIGAQELLLPCLQPIELWKKTGRDSVLNQTLIKFTDRRGRQLCLGPTHEEVITELIKDHVHSYKQLPLILYQIQTKFRDELRPRFGLIRCCEFVMKDAYSFDIDKAGLDKNYKLMFDAYIKIFKRCGLEVIITEADPGIMGGELSHEFMVPAINGEDTIYSCKNCNYSTSNSGVQKEMVCPKCKFLSLNKTQAIEVAHIFQLGTKYSKVQEAEFSDDKGEKRTIIMGCYGIGVSRLLAAVIEKNNDKDGIIYPKNIAPFDVLILPVQVREKDVFSLSQMYYQQFKDNNFKVLLDDRDESAGIKFKDADLIGIPLRITIGADNLKSGQVEIKIRRTNNTIKVDKDFCLEKVKLLMNEIT
ncbi:MAG: proline--tRNA ligase [Candidatus Omnitrophota bacterium]|nr:proline--tRNA ligase [Candidatus Omnitrophota bacterium]